jgi:hypothetical protein
MATPEQEEWVGSLRVEDLKKELKKRGLPISGKKADLAERLLSFLKEEVMPRALALLLCPAAPAHPAQPLEEPCTCWCTPPNHGGRSSAGQGRR